MAERENMNRENEDTRLVPWWSVLLAVGAFNYVFTQTLLATNPQLQALR